MNEVFPRCAVPGSSCRLLQLEAPGARPVWAVLDAAGTRHFTGEITLHCQPMVRAWFNGGELYYAEREGDADLASRLLAMSVLTSDDLATGSVQLGPVTHLGRLFDRVPDLDRDPVELALEILTGEVVGEIADHVVDEITIASYRHHASGVVKWQKRPTVVITQASAEVDVAPSPVAVAPAQPVRQLSVPAASSAPATPLAPPAPSSMPVDLVPTAEDEALVAEYEASLLDPPAVQPELVQAAPVEAELVQPELVQPELVQLAPAQLDPAATAEQPVFDDDLVDPIATTGTAQVAEEHPVAPVADVADAADVAAAQAPAAPAFEPSAEPSIEQAFEPVHESPHPEPAFDASLADDAIASFERSLSARLDAQLGQHFDSFSPENHSSGAAPAAMDATVPPPPTATQIPPPVSPLVAPPVSTPTSTPAFELPTFDLSIQDVMDAMSAGSSDAAASASDPVDGRGGAAATVDVPATEAWAIDDRVDWQLEAAEIVPEPTLAPTPPEAADGPVVEFDLARLLRDADPGSAISFEAAPSSPALRSLGADESGTSDAPDSSDTSDDIRAAVQAALAEIAAATRTGGDHVDHQVPSILMQAAMAADAETGLAPSADQWATSTSNSTSTSTSTSMPVADGATAADPTAGQTGDPAVAPLAARPILPARAPGAPADAGQVDPAAGPPSQEIPATGGLRRLMGTKKT